MDRIFINKIYNEAGKFISQYYKDVLNHKIKNHHKLKIDLSVYALCYNDSAIGEWLLYQNVREFKIKMYMYAELRKKIIGLHTYQTPYLDYFTSINNLYPLIESISSDNWDTVKQYAKVIVCTEDDKKDNPLEYNLLHIVKNLILEQDTSNTYITELENLRSNKEYEIFSGYINTVLGICTKNNSMTEHGLETLVSQYINYEFDDMSLTKYLCVPAIGLAKLAIKKGLDIHFEHELAPKTLINFDEINYPKVEVLEDIN